MLMLLRIALAVCAGVIAGMMTYLLGIDMPYPAVAFVLVALLVLEWTEPKSGRPA
jgi:hypothetical protein